MGRLVLFVMIMVVGLIGLKTTPAMACTYDFGDAPLEYEDYTKYSPSGYNPAKHRYTPQWFGEGVSKESLRPIEDTYDDGIFFPEAFLPGEEGWVKFIAETTRGNRAREQIKIWIDWDQSMSWDLDELLLQCFWTVGSHYQVNGTTVSDSTKIIEYINYFTVPSDALIGTTWLRARIVCQDGLYPTGSWCGSASQGEVEDYPVDVVPEPGSLLLLGAGLLSLAGFKKFRRKR